MPGHEGAITAELLYEDDICDAIDEPDMINKIGYYQGELDEAND